MKRMSSDREGGRGGDGGKGRRGRGEFIDGKIHVVWMLVSWRGPARGFYEGVFISAISVAIF